MEGVVGGPPRPPVYLLPAAADSDLSLQWSVHGRPAGERVPITDRGFRIAEWGERFPAGRRSTTQ